jgi:protein TonB
LSAGIAQSSGAAALDAAALKAVKAAAPYPRAPKGLTEASYSFTLPITFKG